VTKKKLEKRVSRKGARLQGCGQAKGAKLNFD
jgi:hypothetical protein